MAEKILNVFIVDDDPMQAEMSKDSLSKFKQFKVFTFNTGEEALKEINTSGIQPDIVVLDYFLNSQDVKAANGLAVLRKLMETEIKPQVVMVSGQDRIEVAVNCIKYGAFDYVIKNESVFVRLEQVMKKILHERKIMRENRLYKKLFVATIVGFIGLIVFIITLSSMGFDVLGSKNFNE